MMKWFIGLIFLIAGFSQHASAQNMSSIDTGSKFNDYPVGKISRVDLQSGWFGDHFMREYATYEPETVDLEKLKNLIFNHRILIVMAFWCSDSQLQVPRFYKVLDRLRYDYNEIEIISVDRNKLAGEIDISFLDIELVPTFIFYEGAKERGRIIETPDESLEKDTLKILSR
jgi:thiol-disulfide isomerase/thioredoxin